MIAKEINASTVKGLIEYNVKDKSEEIKRNSIPQNFNYSQVCKYFDLQTSNASSQVNYKYKHFILSFHPSEKKELLSNPDKAENIISDFIKANGYQNQPYLVFRHSDTNALHYHIVASAIDIESNKKIYAKNGRWTKRQINNIVNDLNIKHGLIVKGKPLINEFTPNTKNSILRAMQEASSYTFTNDRQLNHIVHSDHNIEILRISNKNDRSKYGYIFKVEHGKVIKSSAFHHTASFKDINKNINRNKKKYNEYIKSKAFKAKKNEIYDQIISASKSSNSIDDINRALNSKYHVLAHYNKEGKLQGIDILDKESKIFIKSSDIKRHLRKDLLNNITHNINRVGEQSKTKESNDIDHSNRNSHYDEKYSKTDKSDQLGNDNEPLQENINNEKDLQQNDNAHNQSSNIGLEDLLDQGYTQHYEEDLDKRKKKKRRKKRR